MKKILIFILISLSCNAQKIAFKSFSDSTGNYLIEYRYNSDFAFVPSVAGAKPHYNADIKVSKIFFSRDTVQMFITKGIFVEGDCFEDIPKNHIVEAKKYLLENNIKIYPRETKSNLGCCGSSPSNKLHIGGQIKN